MNDSSLENPKASPDSSTWYYLVVTSTWGCDSPLDSVLVKVKPTPIAEAGPNLEICGGDTTTLLESYYYTTTDSADPSQIYYSWNPAGTLSDSSVAQPQAWPASGLRRGQTDCTSPWVRSQTEPSPACQKSVHPDTCR